MKEKEIEAFLDKAKDEEVLDGVIEVLAVAQQLLNPNAITANLEYTAGCALQEVIHANQVLRAYREKRYGHKTPMVI